MKGARRNEELAVLFKIPDGFALHTAGAIVSRRGDDARPSLLLSELHPADFLQLAARFGLLLSLVCYVNSRDNLNKVSLHKQASSNAA